MGGDLKNYDDKLVYFVIFNVAWFLLLDFNLELLIKNYQLLPVILSIPIFYFPIYLINNFIHSNWKFVLLYPFKDNHHYASDIFTRILHNKIKINKNLIDIALIIEKYDYYQYSDFEDNLWQKLYYKYRFNPKVYQHHKEFLFCRDLTSIIFPLGCVLIIIDQTLNISYKHISWIILLIALEFLVLRRLAEHQNKKFALSVLQEETDSLKKIRYNNRVSKKSKMVFN